MIDAFGEISFTYIEKFLRGILDWAQGEKIQKWLPRK